MLEWAKILLSFAYDRRMRCRLVGYRPVVMCIVQAVDRDVFLFICPAEKPNGWMPPQEGIDPMESIEKAGARGLEAELGIPESQSHFRRSVWLGSRAIPEQKGERDIEYSAVGMRGKAYYASLIKVSATTPLIPNPAEVAKYEWLDLKQIASRLKTNSERKQELIRIAFNKLLGHQIP